MAEAVEAKTLTGASDKYQTQASEAGEAKEEPSVQPGQASGFFGFFAFLFWVFLLFCTPVLQVRQTDDTAFPSSGRACIVVWVFAENNFFL